MIVRERLTVAGPQRGARPRMPASAPVRGVTAAGRHRAASGGPAPASVPSAGDKRQQAGRWGPPAPPTHTHHATASGLALHPSLYPSSLRPANQSSWSSPLPEGPSQRTNPIGHDPLTSTAGLRSPGMKVGPAGGPLRVPWPGASVTEQHLPTAQEAGSPRSRRERGWFLLRPLCSVCGCRPPHRPMRSRGRPSASLPPDPLFSLRTPVGLDEDPPE